MSDEEVSVEYVYEYWDCPRCGQKEIRGDIRTCTACGATRDESVTFYRKEEDEVVEDSEQVEEFKAGPDWECSFCSTLNSATKDMCGGCGASRESSERNYFDIQQQKADREAETEAATSGSEAESADEESSSGGGKIFFGIAAAVVLAIGGAIWFFTGTTDVKYKVTAASWKVSVPVLRYQWQRSTDWDDQLKGNDIQKISSSREIRSYRKEISGYRTVSYTEKERYQSGTKKECSTSYKSTGSGASKKVKTCKNVPVYKYRDVQKTRQEPQYRQVPVYDMKITYKSKVYNKHRSFTAEGNDNRPKEPEIKLGTGLDEKKDRKGTPISTYNVTLKKVNSDADGPAEAVINPGRKEFTEKYIIGKVVPVPVDNMGEIDLD